jgi:hypothetical protein
VQQATRIETDQFFNLRACSARDKVCSYEGDGVARGENDDVGARDDAWALRLELRLGAVDHVQPAQALVLGVVHLRAVVTTLDQHRRVATLKHRAVQFKLLRSFAGGS